MSITLSEYKAGVIKQWEKHKHDLAYKLWSVEIKNAAFKNATLTVNILEPAKQKRIIYFHHARPGRHYFTYHGTKAEYHIDTPPIIWSFGFRKPYTDHISIYNAHKKMLTLSPDLSRVIKNPFANQSAMVPCMTVDWGRAQIDDPLMYTMAAPDAYWNSICNDDETPMIEFPMKTRKVGAWMKRFHNTDIDWSLAPTSGKYSIPERQDEFALH